MRATGPRQRIQLYCLGPLQVLGSDGRPVRLRTRKQVLLLYLLARQQGRPVTRDRLVSLLWPEDDERRARHSLSHAVSLINKGLGAEVITAAGANRLVLGADAAWIDAAEFEALAADGRTQEARALWRGALFEGLWLEESLPADRWLADERARLARVFRRLMHGVLDHLRRSGDVARLRAESELVLEQDDLDEEAQLALLEAMTLQGDRTSALRHYAAFEQRLAEELDAEPGPALRTWARRQRREEAALDRAAAELSARVAEATVLPSVQPLYGRTEEYGLLWETWERTRNGRGALIVLQGDPGIGKTALATKLVNQVHVGGASVCFVRCYRTEKAVPFAPIANLVRQLSRLPGFVATSAVWIGELTRLVPELRDRYPQVPGPMAIDDSARNRLCDAAVAAAMAVADEQPLLLAVDDLQDADEASLALLHYLGRRTAELPLFLLGVQRTGHEPTEYERTFVETARSAGFGRFVSVGPLGEAELVRLIQQTVARRGLDAPAAAVERILALAQGNPLHAIEAALSWSERDEAVGGGTAAAGAAPLSFEESAGERLAGLPPAARMAATSLAVAGRPLTEHELATVANIRPAELAAAVAALERSDFVRRTGPAVGFVHERYAPAAEALLTEPERRATHLRFARLLARTETTHPASGYEAARHFAAAGRRGSALAHAQQAARYAGSIGAERGRADALELAWGVQSAPDAELAVDLGVCQLALGEWDRLAALAAESEARCAFTAGQRAAFAYLGIAARSLAGRATQEETREALSALLTGAPPFAQRNEAVLLLMRTADKTGHYGEVKRLARELRRAETCVTAELSEYALFAAGYVFCKYYWPRKALPLLELALHKAQKGNNWRLAQASREACGVALKMVGKFRESVEQFEISLALARKTMNPQAEALTLQNRAVSEMALGIESVAMDTFREAAKVGDQGWALRLFSPYNQALIWFSQGDYLRAKRTFETTVESATRARVLFLQADCYAGIGLCCQRVGDRDGLREATARLNAVEPEGTSPRLGWIDKAANAWNRALNEREGDAAVARLALECERLARRDVAYWLSLECEKVFLAEAVTNARDPSGRNRLASLAKRYEARGVERLLATS